MRGVDRRPAGIACSHITAHDDGILRSFHPLHCWSKARTHTHTHVTVQAGEQGSVGIPPGGKATKQMAARGGNGAGANNRGGAGADGGRPALDPDNSVEFVVKVGAIWLCVM